MSKRSSKIAKVLKSRKKAIEPTTTLEMTTVSRLKCFTTCHRKYFWTFVKNYESRALHIPFFVGGMVHHGLDMFYDGQERDNTIQVVSKMMDDELVDIFIPPEHTGKVDIQRAIVLGMIYGYFEHYAKEQGGHTSVFTEQPFEFMLPNIPLRFRCVIDRIYKKGKSLWIHEHKTASKISSDYMERLPMDTQVQMYPIATTKCLKVRPKGVCYNVLRKPQIRQRKTETFEQFTARIAEDYVNRPDFYFHREEIIFNKKHSTAVMMDVLAQAEELWMYYDSIPADQILDPQSWYRDTQRCFDFFQKCPYYPLCRYGERPDIMLKYKEREDVENAHESIKEDSVKKDLKKKASKKASRSPRSRTK